MPEQAQVPFVAGHLGLGAGEGPAGIGLQRVHEADEAEAAAHLGGVVADPGDLAAAQVVADGPQVGLLGLHPLHPTTPLEPEQDLGQHEWRQPSQAHLAADAHRRLGPSPVDLVEIGHSPAGRSKPLLVGVAVGPVGVAPLTGTGGDPAGTIRRKGHDAGMVEEGLLRHAHRLVLIGMGAAQPGWPRGLLPPAAGHGAGRRRSVRSLSRCEQFDLIDAEAGGGEAPST